jgi:hypothetical protein
MKRFLVVFALLVAPALVHAQQEYPRDITLSWTNADSYEDGTLIEAGDLTGTRIECFRQNDSVPMLTGTFAPTGEGLSQTEVFVGAIPQPGTYTCYGYSVVVGGIESVASNPAQKKYVGKPKPPASWKIDG